ncbi:TadE/TadG family type IV pilus assembly protein [Parelusimicrobium proximum]|uniref:TadE/TadG family type IV pilus assembly protein n=1 Tax=Parelusimicrobium proximum TaxID=3228953 RepID=UPI003D164730
MRRMLSSKSGQFLLPAVLLVPTVMLVIYLIFETGKLSREKIRHQLALDVSAFAELTPAATFLNGTAYVNGFPYRIFREMMPDVVERNRHAPDSVPDYGPSMTLFDFFYNSGAFLSTTNSESWDSWKPKDSDTRWHYSFAEGKRSEWESEQPVEELAVASEDDNNGFVPITDKEAAAGYNFTFEVVKEGLLVYVTAFDMLGSIYNDQKSVYEKISKNHEFFRKSYYLNTRTCKQHECAREATSYIRNIDINTRDIGVSKIRFYYAKFFGGADSEAIVRANPIDLEMSELLEGKSKLFQLGYLDAGTRNNMPRVAQGIEIRQSFEPPSNYFNVNLKKYKPFVRVRVAIQCPDKRNNCVWPNPTPKYQIRLYP